MSSSHIAFCYIEVEKELSPEELVFIDRQVARHVESGHLNEPTCNNTDTSYSFELSGNNGIDYTILEEIKSLLEPNHKDLLVQATEYVDVEEGFYFGKGKHE
jgi:hypothetical protein